MNEKTATMNRLRLLFDKGGKTIKWEESFQEMMLGQLKIYMQKNEVEPLSHTVHKN